MKTLRLIGMALMAVVLCVGFAACSDDDDVTPATLGGTTWRITDTDDDVEPGVIFTFNKDNTITSRPSVGTDVTWSVSGNTLKIVFDDDDYIEGTLSINGNKATYRYKWYDVNGDWFGDDEYSMILRKQ